MTGSNDSLTEDRPIDVLKPRCGWNALLLNGIEQMKKGNREPLAQLCQQARNEILSTEYLKSQRPISGSTGKMAAAGDDIGL